MADVKRIKFEYYNVVCRKPDDKVNDPDTQFDLTIWIEEALSKDMESRTKQYYSDPVRVEDIIYLEHSGLWYLNFNRLSTRNVPNIAKLDESGQPIELGEDEYIGHDVSAIFDEELHVLMLQRNRLCMGPSGIGTYINAVPDKVEQLIYLRPIIRKDIESKLANPKLYKSFTLRFCDLQNMGDAVSEQVSIFKFVNAVSEYKPVVAEIKISMGRNKSKSLDAATVKESLADVKKALADVKANKHYIDKAEVSIKADDDTEVEIIDLFTDKLHEIIEFKSEDRVNITHDMICKRMVEQYLLSKNKIKEHLSMQ